MGQSQLRLPVYWILIPVLLLSVCLGMQRLDGEGLWYDEIWSVMVAGGANFGPHTAPEILSDVVFKDPTQGMGYPLILGGWGAAAGWSEYSIRVLSLLAAVIAVALAYRLGSEVESRLTGLLAALIMSVSAFFVWYMHEGRTYTIVVMLALILLWAYRRIQYGTKPVTWKTGAAFVLSGAGLLYANYFAVSLLAALAMYHLLFAPKNRRWWYTTYLAVMAGIAFAPSLVGFMSGFGRYSSESIWSEVRARSLSVPQLTGIIGYFAANGSTLLLLILLAAGAYYAWQRGQSARMVVFVIWSTMLVTLAIQQVTLLIDFTKVRYVLVMWGPVAICAAMGMVYIGQTILARARRALPLQNTGAGHSRLAFAAAALIPVVWLVGGVHASLDPFYMTEKGLNGDIPRWRGMVNILRQEGLPRSDVFAWYAGTRAHDDEMSFGYSMYEVPFTSFITFSVFDPPTADWAAGKMQEAQRIWYGIDKRIPSDNDHTRFVQLLAEDGFVPCSVMALDEPTTSLQLYVRSPAFCPGGEPIVRFANGISLTGWQALPASVSSTLNLAMGWKLAPEVPSDTFSIGLYVQDGEKMIAQGDTALPYRPFDITQSTIDLTGVPPGEYSVTLAVYYWQTFERLNGTHLQTGETGSTLTMGKIKVAAP